MARPKERINNFLQLIDGHITEIFEDIFHLALGDDIDIVVDEFYDSINIITAEWNVNPDWRFSQVLVNLGIIPNAPGMWYYLEESEILDALGIRPRNYLLWGKNYDKDMNRLPETEYALIADLETDHIKSILSGGWCKHGPHFDCFNEELKIRENENND